MNEQLTLDLEYPVHDHYLVELRRADKAVRTTMARDVDGAIGLIDGFREYSENRDGVIWRDEEVDAKGDLFGLGPGGVTWQIHVSPSLTTELSQ